MRLRVVFTSASSSKGSQSAPLVLTDDHLTSSRLTPAAKRRKVDARRPHGGSAGPCFWYGGSMNRWPSPENVRAMASYGAVVSAANVGSG